MVKHSSNCNPNSPPKSLDSALQCLATADNATFAKQWFEAFGHSLPKALNRRIARVCLIYRLQEQHLGGLSRDATRQLAELMPTTSTACSRPARVRRYKPGTRLMRTWRGRTYVVTIASPGYLYDGRTYSSLSVIAREITGTPWSGPAFFGLRTKAVVGARP